MTAFFAAAYEDRIELLTDGSVVRDDGTIANLADKAWRCDTLPIAFAGRGNVGALIMTGPVTLGMLAACGTVDGTLAAFIDELETGLPRLRGAKIDGVICAISEADGPGIYYFTTADTVAGFDPFVLYNVTPIHGCGSEPTEEAFAAYGFPERLLTEPLSDCGADMFTVLRATKMPHENAGGHLVYGVGGHADLTTVTPEGATTRRLHTWPEDQIGLPIDPIGSTQ
ncbi:hypothetical protein ABGN05_14655 [Aquibium sp. LZ166]|uniref:DUF4261 domain-containing protein n=1 Tax=Aquibium pacificus TaxID=3153579 RepID=A0ABV3SJH3_9HYPH